MVTATRRGILAVVTAVVLLALGAGVAVTVGAPETSPDADSRESDLAVAWAARVLLALAVAWVVIGMLSARTRLVRRPGAAAARASWLSATRPWRARESTLGMLPLDRWLMIIVPAALLVATRTVQTDFRGGWYVLVVLLGWLAFAAVVRLVVGRRSPWPVIAAVGGVVVLRCLIALAALAVSGPEGVWPEVWADPVRRGAYVAIAVALLLWAYVAAGWALATQLGRRRATGAVLAAVGASLVVPLAAIAVAGAAGALAAGDDELGLTPALGASARVDLPAETAWLAAALIVAGALLALPRRRGTRVGGGS